MGTVLNTFFDVFLPEQSQAVSMRKIAGTMGRGVALAPAAGVRQDVLNDLRDDIGFLSLLTMVELKVLMDKGLVTKEEIMDKMGEIDALDGVKNGRLNVGVLRGAVGQAVEQKKRTPARRLCPHCRHVVPSTALKCMYCGKALS